MAALVALGTADATSHGPAAEPSSIVLIVTDDQRWDTLWAMPRVQEMLVDRGVTFANAFVTNPLCCPSRATILTGRYSHDTGVYANLPPDGGFQAFEDSSTIATWLQDSGYRTAFVGKYLNEYDWRYRPPGWDRWFALAGWPRYFGYAVSEDGDRTMRGREAHDYSTDVLAAEAVSFIESTDGHLFLHVAPLAAHADIAWWSKRGWKPVPAPRDRGSFADLDPWRPPSFDERDASDKPPWIRRASLSLEDVEKIDTFRRKQLESLQAVDRAVSEIVDALEQTGRLENAVIVFTSDNGFSLGEHRWVSKWVPYEESIRVPLVIRHDPLTADQRTDDHLVLNVDLAQTLAELAGAEAPGAKGRSLVPLLADKPGAWRSDFVLESMPTEIPPYCGIRTTRFMYAQHRGGFEELYDLASDPHELQNLAHAPELRRRLVDFRERVRELCNPPTPGLTLLSPCLASGTGSGDRLTGTRWYDLACGRGGDDRIRAGPGPDAVLGGRGRDLLRSGSGSDRIHAADGERDRVNCGPGNDIAFADAFDVLVDCERPGWFVARGLAPRRL